MLNFITTIRESLWRELAKHGVTTKLLSSQVGHELKTQRKLSYHRVRSFFICILERRVENNSEDQIKESKLSS